MRYVEISYRYLMNYHHQFRIHSTFLHISPHLSWYLSAFVIIFLHISYHQISSIPFPYLPLHWIKVHQGPHCEPWSLAKSQWAETSPWKSREKWRVFIGKSLGNPWKSMNIHFSRLIFPKLNWLRGFSSNVWLLRHKSSPTTGEKYPIHSHKNWQSRTVARSTPHLLNTPEPARIIKSGASPDSHPMGIGIFQLGLLFSSQLDMKGSHLSPRQRRESEHVEPCAQKSQPRRQHGAWCQWPSGLPHLRRLCQGSRQCSCAKSSSTIKLSLIHCSEGWQHDIAWTASTSFSNF